MKKLYPLILFFICVLFSTQKLNAAGYTPAFAACATQYTSLDDTICQGDSVLFAGMYYNSTGAYVDSLLDINSCDSIVTLNLVVNPTYAINNPQDVCYGDSYSINGNTYSSNGTYYDTLQTINGCDSVIITTITVRPLFTTTLTHAICDGDSILLAGSYRYTASIYNDTLQSIYGCDSIIANDLTVYSVYSVNNPQTICQGTSYEINGNSYTSSGTYNDTLQSINGCDSVIITTLTVIPVPTLSVTASSYSICSGDSALLVASGADSYAWSPSSGLSSSTADSVKAAPSSTTTYTVTGTSANCSVQKTVKITVNPLPGATISGATTVCYGSTQSYTVNVTSGCTYSWSVIGGMIGSGQTSSTVKIYWNTAGTGTLVVTKQISKTGCIARDTISVEVEALPTPDITGTNTLCAGTAAVAYASPGISGNSYNWTVSGGNIVYGQGSDSILVDWSTSAGARNVKLTETSPNGCVAYSNFAVTVNPLPASFAITGSNSVCEGNNTASYSVKSVAGLTYNWSVSSGSIAGGQGTNAAQASWDSSGSITCVEANSYGCSATASLAVTVKESPDAAITGTGTVCQGATNIAFNATSQTGNSYTWTFTNASILSGAGTASVFVNFSKAGTASVTLNIKGANGCTSVDTFLVTVNPTYSTSNKATICQGDSFTFADGTVSTVAGTHTSKLSNMYGCDSIIITTLSVDNLALTTSIKGSATVLKDSTYQYQATAQNGITYTWQVVGGSVVSGQGSTIAGIKWDTKGTGIVRLVGANSNGCVDSVTLVVDIGVVGVKELTKDSYKIYPNPAHHQLNIEWAAENKINYIRLTDLSGRTVAEAYPNSNKLIIDITDVTSGIYVVELQGNNASTFNKIVVE